MNEPPAEYLASLEAAPGTLGPFGLACWAASVVSQHALERSLPPDAVRKAMLMLAANIAQSTGASDAETVAELDQLLAQLRTGRIAEA